MPKGSNTTGQGMFSHLNQPAYVDPGQTFTTLANALNPNFDDNPFTGPTYTEQQTDSVTSRYQGGIGVSGPINPLTGAPAGSIGPPPSTSNAIARAEIRGLRKACNGAGNYYAGGICYTGQAAVNKATEQANADNEGLNKKGSNWLEEHSDEIDENGNFTGEVTAQQADVANAVNQNEIDRQKAVEDITGEDRSDKISQVVDVIQNTIVTELNRW